MHKIQVDTPECSVESLNLYDDVYPLCGVDWYTQKVKDDINITNLTVNLGSSVSVSPAIRPHSNLGDNDDEQSDIDINVENSDNDESLVSENGDDEEKMGSEDEEMMTKGNTPPKFVPSAPNPKKKQTAGKYDCVLSPNFRGKHICLIRKEIKNSKYFFLYEQNCQCIMSIRNKDNLNLKCSAFVPNSKCCCFVSIGYVSIAIGDGNNFIILYAPIPKCTVHRTVCKIFNYKGKKDKLYLGKNDFIYYDDNILSTTPWLTIIPFNESLNEKSVRNIFVSRYHITQSLYKVNVISIFCNFNVSYMFVSCHIVIIKISDNKWCFRVNVY